MGELNMESFLLRAREVCGAEHVFWPNPGSAILVQPETTSQVSSIVRAAREHDCRLRLFSPEDTCGEGGVLLDLRRMNQIVQQDALGSWVFAQTGITPAELETRLNAAGFTLRCHFAGHQNLPLAGLFSLPVPGFHPGPAIHRLIAVTGVWVDGSTFRTRISPRQAVGPDLRTFFARQHGASVVVTEACLAVFSTAVPTGYETLSFSSLSEAQDTAFSLLGAAPLSPLEQALEFDQERWLLHLWFWGPAACVAVARDRAAHRPKAVARGEGPAREFWVQRALADTTPRAAVGLEAEALARLELAPGDFVSCFAPGRAILYTVRPENADPVFLGEPTDPVLSAWLRSCLDVKKEQ